ncbi:MAG: hypothetical protein JRN67_04350, partial [Nitrososphaerota archaeon]|nr:hypothetical protein [Nitrososphaerota archaeon]
ILAGSVVLGSVTGYTFLVAKQPPTGSSTTSNISQTTQVTSSGQSQTGTTSITGSSITTQSGFGSSSSSSTLTTTQTSVLTSTKTSTVTSGVTTTVSTATTPTTTATSASNSSGSTVTSTETTTATGTDVTTVGGSTVTTTVTSSSTSTTTVASQTQAIPTDVVVQGSVSTTGEGTQVSSLIISGNNNYYAPTIVSNTFTVTLPNDANYLMIISWKGAYSWQNGLYHQQLPIYENSSTLSMNLVVQTPNSAAEVTGTITTTGTGTSPNLIVFRSSHGSFNQTVSSGEYAISLPNYASYNVTVNWGGEYAWQSGSYLASNFDLNSSSSVITNWNVQTPNSEITVSGNLTASGIGTHPTTMMFSLGNTTTKLSTSLSGTFYSISLPNQATYSVSVGWAGSYSWQSGNVSAGDYVLSLLAGASASKNWNVQIPDTEVTVSGVVTTSGSGTQASEILFSGVSGNFTAIVRGGAYSITLPNTVQYEATIIWSGSYSWQEGSVTYQLPVFAGAGSSSFTASWIVPTPNSSVTVSGTVTSQNGSPVEIRFVSSDGQITEATSVVNGSYSIILPDEMNYTVTIYLAGSNTPTNDGIFQLFAAPGVTTIVANWIS